MINGIRWIWIRLLMNSHSTNAGAGSNRMPAGARVFQPSHAIVHTAMTMKKPMVPTWSVVQIAMRSRREKLCRYASLTLVGLASAARHSFASVSASTCASS
jgi:hypothetical protein